MKKLAFIMAMFVMISASAFGQYSHVNNVPQVWNNTPVNTTGGVLPLLLNATTNLMELPGYESDSARKYTALGRSTVYVKYLTRDTIRLVPANYAIGQITRFIVTASGADTTVFVPTSGTVAGASSYTMTGTQNALSLMFDGTNYWISK